MATVCVRLIKDDKDLQEQVKLSPPVKIAIKEGDRYDIKNSNDEGITFVDNMYVEVSSVKAAGDGDAGELGADSRANELANELGDGDGDAGVLGADSRANELGDAAGDVSAAAGDGPLNITERSDIEARIEVLKGKIQATDDDGDKKKFNNQIKELQSQLAEDNRKLEAIRNKKKDEQTQRIQQTLKVSGDGGKRRKTVKRGRKSAKRSRKSAKKARKGKGSRRSKK